MKIVIALIILISSIYPSKSANAEHLPLFPVDTLKHTQTKKINAIIDPITLQMKDDTLVRLTGVDIPDLGVHDHGPISTLAQEVISDALKDETVLLYQTQKEDWGRTNRMGHSLAHIARGKDQVWIQGMLIRLGLARVHTTPRNNEASKEMLALETKARNEKLGLWSDEKYAIKTPETIGAYQDSYQILEGRVHGVALNKNRIYINFGTNWKEDATVSIAPENKRLFTKAGLNPQQWNGKRIRTRGWVRSYNGPYIEIDHPAAVEILDE